MRRGVAGLVAGLWLAAATPAAAQDPFFSQVGTERAGATVDTESFYLDLLSTRLRAGAQTGAAPLGGVGYRSASGWINATRATAVRRSGGSLLATFRTTQPGSTVGLRLTSTGKGTLAATVTAPAGALATSMAFQSPASERFWGFGQRSNGVDQRGREVENYVSDGPFREPDRALAAVLTPPWATRDRDDSTYYPVPWMLSSRGYGVLIDEDVRSAFRLGLDRPDTWSMQADGPRLRARFFSGPTPAAALARFTRAVGRQPPPPAPWAFGPWFQTGQPNVIPLADEARITRTLRNADAPVSAAETQMHYLPCGAQRGNGDYLRRRNRYFHAQGLAHLAYFNPALCESYASVYQRADALGLLQKRAEDGRPFLYSAFVGGSGPAGFTQEPLAQFDFTAPGTEAFYADLVREAVMAGHDGWMEDFGENSPPQALSADGSDGDAVHNRYPRLYHCTVQRIARRLSKPVVRFQRSGWTGAARCADLVWGGDPTTVWGFDGLQSSVRQALSIGMSGVSRWGSDIGGYNSFNERERLTPELLKRWIQFGAVSGVMRTKRSGIALPSYERPQIFDPGVLPTWRRYAKLHTQLHPYLVAADRRYRRTGLPLMSHLALSWPRDRRALAREGEFMFGPSLLAAPVVTPGARRRRVYAPPGRWLDFWRSVRYVKRTGGFTVGRARSVRGGQEHVLPAPLAQLPMLIRTGSVLPLLPADVDTLAGFGRRRGLVHLRDRRHRMTLLAFPRGRTRASFNEGERLVSAEGRGAWKLRLAGTRRRSYRLEASMATLRRPFRPCSVSLAGRAVPRSSWRYLRRARVLRVRFAARRSTLTVRACGVR